MTVRVWVNGHLRGDEASLSALDHGVTVGDGAFETLKIVDGRPFAMTRHARQVGPVADRPRASRAPTTTSSRRVPPPSSLLVSRSRSGGCATR